MAIKIIAAGAGSGKTFRITEELVNFLEAGSVKPSGIIATTFTNAAAAELKDRVKLKLLEKDKADVATQLSNALIGTVHSVGIRLIKRFAFEVGVSPEISIMAEQDEALFFNQSLSNMLSDERIERMSRLSELLGFQKSANANEWRTDVKTVSNLIRQNNFNTAAVEISKQRSWLSYKAYLPPPLLKESDAKTTLKRLLEQLLLDFEDSSDTTKTTAEQILIVRSTLADLQKEIFPWYHWVKLSKLKPGKKSDDLFDPLKNFAAQHIEIFEFQEHIQEYVATIFDLAESAIAQYQHFKKVRGLVDYTDMEAHILELLDIPEVKDIIREEIDLLIVDEFQDTSPLQLAIFLKLSMLANEAIWVGDTKQSIYGFRGAEPRLMQAIIDRQGGVRPQDILSNSWRSRPDLVNMSNAIFTRAFPTMDPEQIVLQAKVADDSRMEKALQYWYFQQEPPASKVNQNWYYRSIATALKKWIATAPLVRDKKSNDLREATFGDIAILCRTNLGCTLVAQALHHVGIKAATPRIGLLETKEIQFFVACLKLIFSKRDTIAIAEILLLATDLSLDEIADHRANFLSRDVDQIWADDFPIIRAILDLRRSCIDLSVTEICELTLNTIDIQRIVTAWGDAAQRWSNLDKLLSYAKQYEDACSSMYHSATVGGFLLWLKDLNSSQRDEQAYTSDAWTVQVTTYHKSKGLEWPIVLALNLEADVKDKLFGFSIEALAEEQPLDLDNVLGNRWIRFWVNPYDNLSKNTILATSIESGREASQQQQLALDEEKRLLYVGLTRARDYQIFTGNKDAARWLNRVYNEGNEDAAVFDNQTKESSFFYNHQIIPVTFREWVFPETIEEGMLEDQTPKYFEERTGPKSFPPQKLHPETWTKKVKAKVLRTVAYGSVPIERTEKLQNIIQSYLMINFATNSFEQRLQTLQSIASRYKEDVVPAQLQRIVQQMDSLEEFFVNLGILRQTCAYPVMGTIDQQTFQAIIPRVIVNDFGWNLVMYNFSDKMDKSNLTEMKLAASVIQQQQICSMRFWLVYPFTGVLEELELS